MLSSSRPRGTRPPRYTYDRDAPPDARSQNPAGLETAVRVRSGRAASQTRTNARGAVERSDVRRARAARCLFVDAAGVSSAYPLRRRWPRRLHDRWQGTRRRASRTTSLAGSSRSRPRRAARSPTSTTTPAELLTSSDPNGDTTIGYDPVGRITSVSRGGRETGYAYDDAGRTLSVAYPGETGTVAYGYDAAGRPETRDRLGCADRRTTHYDAARQGCLARPAGRALRPPTRTTTRPAADARPARGRARPLLAQAWTYDADGNVALGHRRYRDRDLRL